MISVTVYVEGSCSCPTPGYTLELRRKEPQGINEKDLLLELVETPPPGPVDEIVTETPVRQYEERTEFDYDTVSIVPGGPTGIPVKDVS